MIWTQRRHFQWTLVRVVMIMHARLNWAQRSELFITSLKIIFRHWLSIFKSFRNIKHSKRFRHFEGI